MSNIWTKNLFDYKPVRIFALVIIILFAVYYVVDYFSVESKCRREIEQYGSLFGSPVNETKSYMRKIAVDSAVKSCVENSK